MALYWPQGRKKDTIKFGRPICNSKIAQNWPQVFLALTPSVKWALYHAGSPGILLNNMP